MANNKKPQIWEEAPASVRSHLQRAEKREDTRSKIALHYVQGFIIVVIYALTLFWVKGMEIDDLRDLLLALSGILSGPLGFIIGFYFKTHMNGEE